MAFFSTQDQVRIHYTVSGSGQPLLLVPGWSCSLHFFDKNFRQMQDLFDILS